MGLIVANANARAVAIFGCQPNYADIFTYGDVFQTAVVTIQEDTHYAAAVIDKDGVRATLGCNEAVHLDQAALVCFQGGLDRGERCWRRLAGAVGADLLP